VFVVDTSGKFRNYIPAAPKEWNLIRILDKTKENKKSGIRPYTLHYYRLRT
jgi:hypothetical protein